MEKLISTFKLPTYILLGLVAIIVFMQIYSNYWSGKLNKLRYEAETK